MPIFKHKGYKPDARGRTDNPHGTTEPPKPEERRPTLLDARMGRPKLPPLPPRPVIGGGETTYPTATKDTAPRSKKKAIKRVNKEIRQRTPEEAARGKLRGEAYDLARQQEAGSREGDKSEYGSMPQGSGFQRTMVSKGIDAAADKLQETRKSIQSKAEQDRTIKRRMAGGDMDAVFEPGPAPLVGDELDVKYYDEGEAKKS